jgi:hypothetical protein
MSKILRRPPPKTKQSTKPEVKQVQTVEMSTQTDDVEIIEIDWKHKLVKCEKFCELLYSEDRDLLYSIDFASNHDGRHVNCKYCDRNLDDGYDSDKSDFTVDEHQGVMYYSKTTGEWESREVLRYIERKTNKGDDDDDE